MQVSALSLWKRESVVVVYADVQTQPQAGAAIRLDWGGFGYKHGFVKEQELDTLTAKTCSDVGWGK